MKSPAWGQWLYVVVKKRRAYIYLCTNSEEERKTNSSVRKLFCSIKIVFLIPLLSNPNGIILSSLTRNCSKWSWHRKGYPNIMVETQKSLFNIWLNNLPFNRRITAFNTKVSSSPKTIFFIAVSFFDIFF